MTRKDESILVALGVFVFLVAGIAYFNQPVDPHAEARRFQARMDAGQAERAAEQERDLNDNKGSAAVACQEFVTRRLKSPGSADFPWNFGEVTSTGDTFTVRSHVDSQNSYGALLRTNYVCTVEDRGESWFLVEMDLSER